MLKDMKRKKQNAKLKYSEPESEPYPYGLRLSLGTEELKKLGIDPQHILVGDNTRIGGMGKIVSININDSINNKNSNVDIQIEKLDISISNNEANIRNMMKNAK